MDDSLNAALNALAESNAILGWVQLALEGKSVSDAASSFPLVRMALDVRIRADVNSNRTLERSKSVVRQYLDGQDHDARA